MASGDPNSQNRPRGLRNVTVLGIVSFFTDFSTEMIAGMLPSFIVTELGASKALLGGIEGSAELVSYAFRLVSGSLSDKFHRRKIFILFGYGLSTISKPFFSVSFNWTDVLLVRISDRIGKGVRTAPRDALISDSVTETTSGKAFGIHRSLDQSGAIAGPIAGYALLQFFDVRDIFILSLIPGVIAVIILVFFVKEVIGKDITEGIQRNFLYLLNQNRPFTILLLITGIFGLGAYNFSFVLLKSSDLGVIESTIPLVYAAINITHTAVSIPSGILADRIGKEKVLVLGYGVLLVSSFLMVLLSGNFLYAFVVALIYGIYLGVTETVQRAVLPKYVDSNVRGTAYGLYNLVIGVGFFIGNILFGYLWDAYSLDVAISFSSIFVAGAMIGMIMFIKKFNLN
ncbi:MAG TPA: MFS transporter [Nitrososphaeraceae archaeon]|nr:MFS transporter [Nitrososphaeraceae archaeon]